jgi:hypothetical protein
LNINLRNLEKLLDLANHNLNHFEGNMNDDESLHLDDFKEMTRKNSIQSAIEEPEVKEKQINIDVDGNKDD